MVSKPLRVIFDEIGGFIKIYGGIRYLVLFDCGWCDNVCNSIKYLTSEKESELIHITLYLL